MNPIKKRTDLLVVTFVVLFVSGCDVPPQVQLINKITEIDAKPLDWENHTVRLKGKVTNQLAIPFVDFSVYVLNDETGSVNVVTKSGLPARGASVVLTGKVKSSFVMGSFSAGLVVIESVRIAQ